jgi:4-amino-4-deoxy-L-arabinose transferase-like glycosyltransferase
MNVSLLRIFMYSILPLLVAGVHVALDKTVWSRERKLELFLIYLFGLGVAATGIGGFFGHLFLSDLVAESIGWPSGNPFQLEVGFANLALGIMGIIAMSRRDGFREATVIAVTVFGVGATIVHIMDIIGTGNLAPGNTVQNISNLLRPALLIGFLSASRRAERLPDSEVDTTQFEIWRLPRVQAAGLMTFLVATGFGVGFALDSPLIGAAVGIIVGSGVVALIISRAPESKHQP